MLYNNALDKIKFYKGNPDYEESSKLYTKTDFKNATVRKNLIKAVKNNTVNKKVDIGLIENIISTSNKPFTASEMKKIKGQLNKVRFGQVPGTNLTSFGDIINNELDTYYNPAAPPIYLHPDIAPQGSESYHSYRFGDTTNIPRYDPLAVAPFDTLNEKQKEERLKKYGPNGVPQSYIDSKNPPRVNVQVDKLDPLRLTNILIEEKPLELNLSNTQYKEPFKPSRVVLREMGNIKRYNNNKPYKATHEVYMDDGKKWRSVSNEEYEAYKKQYPGSDESEGWTGKREHATGGYMYPDGGKVRWVKDANDPMYKKYIAEKRLSEFSNLPYSHKKHLLHNDQDFLSKLTNNISNLSDEEWKSLLIPFDSEISIDPTEGDYGEKIEYGNSKLFPTSSNSPGFGDIVYQLNDPMYKTDTYDLPSFLKQYPPNSYDTKAKYSNYPIGFSFASKRYTVTNPNTDYIKPYTAEIEDSTDLAELQKVYPKLTKEQLLELVTDLRPRPYYQTNIFDSGFSDQTKDISRDQVPEDKQHNINYLNKRGYYYPEAIKNSYDRYLNVLPKWNAPIDTVEIMPPDLIRKEAKPIPIQEEELKLNLSTPNFPKEFKPSRVVLREMGNINRFNNGQPYKNTHELYIDDKKGWRSISNEEYERYKSEYPGADQPLGWARKQEKATGGYYAMGGEDDKFTKSTQTTKDFYKQWYTGRAKNPKFTDVANKRLDLLNSNNYPKASILPYNSMSVEGEYFPETNTINYSDTDLLNRNYANNINGLITHENDHWLSNKAPQGFINANNAISDTVKQNTAWLKGLSPEDQDEEIRARLSVWRQINNIDPTKEYSPKELRNIINKNLDDENLDSNLKDLYESIKFDPEQLKYFNDTFVYNQPRNENIQRAATGGYINPYHQYTLGSFVTEDGEDGTPKPKYLSFEELSGYQKMEADNTRVAPVVPKLQASQYYAQADKDVKNPKITDDDFKDKYGTNKHVYQMNSNPKYRAEVEANAKELVKRNGSIDYPSTYMDSKSFTGNPNLNYMIPNGLTGEARKAYEQSQMDVVGALLPIPGLQQMGKIPSIGTGVKNLAKFIKPTKSVENAANFGLSGPNLNYPQTINELNITPGYGEPLFHEKAFNEKIAELATNFKTPEGRRRIQNLIDNNPQLQNTNVDDFIKRLEESKFATTEPYMYKADNKNPLYIKKQIDELLKQKVIDPPKPGEYVVNKAGQRVHFNVNPEGANSWFRPISVDWNDPKSVKEYYTSLILNNGKRPPHHIAMGSRYSPYDAKHILEHEIAGHYTQHNAPLIGVDDELANITMRDADEIIKSRTKKEGYFPLKFGNKNITFKGQPIEIKNPLFKKQPQTSDLGWSATNTRFGTAKDSGPFGVNTSDAWRKNQLKQSIEYFLNGSGGQEKAAFAAEVRANLLERGLLKNRYDTITPELLKTHYNLYHNTIGDKYNLRLYDIMDNNDANFSFLAKALNNLPVTVGAVATGVVGANALQQNNQPQQQAIGGYTNPYQQYAQGGYTNPYNQYQKDPYLNYADGGYMYGNGGRTWKNIGAGAFGVLEGVVDTTFGWIPGVDYATDMAYKGLQKIGGSTADEIREQDSIHGYGQTVGAVGSAILTSGATTGNAISEGAEGLGQGISRGSETSEVAQGIGKGLNIAGAVVGTAYNASNAGKAAKEGFKLSKAGSEGLGKFAAAAPKSAAAIKAANDTANAARLATTVDSAGNVIGNAAPEGTKIITDAAGNASSIKPPTGVLAPPIPTTPSVSSLAPNLPAASTAANAAIPTALPTSLPSTSDYSKLEKVGDVVSGLSALPKSQEPPPMAPPMPAPPIPKPQPQVNYDQFTVNAPTINTGFEAPDYDFSYNPNTITFSQGGNMLNNSLNLRNTMRYKRFARGGTFDQYGINYIPESAGLHHESAYGGVPIGPNALAEGGEIKMNTGDGGQYIVSDQVDGAESQKDFTFSKGGKYKELNRTLADGMKQDLNKYVFGSLATSDRVKNNLRRPNDSYAQSTIDQIKQKWQQKTEYARQRSQQEQAIAQAEEQKRMAEEQYVAAYGGRINPKKYPGLNMTKKAKGGYVHNQMTQPMLATGGPIYGDPASEYVYAIGGMYGDPYARGGQIDYTSDMYYSGGPMVGNAPQSFRGPAGQNRGGMLMAYPDGGMMSPEQQMQQQAPQEQMQQQGGGEEQMMQMVQQVMEALMQGAQPEQIMQQLMQSGVPQEQAQQIVQMAMQEAQGQQQQQPMQGQGQQMPPQQGMADGGMMQQSDTINKIAEALQQGAQPEEILQQLVQSGMPQEQAVAMVQQVMSQMQQPQQQSAPQQGMMARGGRMYYTGGPEEPLPGMYDSRWPMTSINLNRLSLNDALNNEYKLPELPNNKLTPLPPSKPADMSIYNEESVPGVDFDGREVSWNPALLEDYDANGNKVYVNPNTLGDDWINTRQQTGEGAGAGQNARNSKFSVLDAALGAAQLAGPLDQYIKGSKYDRVRYPKAQPNLLNPTAAIATMTQEQQRAQDIAGYGIRQQAPTSGSYLANIRANALQFGKQRGLGAAGIRGQYDLQNAGILNQFGQYNNNLTVEGMRDEAANKGAAATNQTNALYSAAANLTGMRKDYKQAEIDKTIADNIGTNNWKLSSDGKLVIFRDTKTGNIVSKPISDIQQGG